MINENSRTDSQTSKKLVNRLGFKCFIIAVIGLLLLIPTSMVSNLIEEREEVAENVIREVSDQWCSKQEVIAPCLTLEKILTSTTRVENNDSEIDDKRTITSYTKKKLNILPHNLDITGNIETKVLKRSIYNVVTYESPLTLTGDFQLTEEELQTVLPFEGLAEIDFAVSNLKGISDEITLQFGQQRVVLTPNGTGLDNRCKKMSAKVDISDLLTGKSIPFSMTISLKGSKSINFVPVAKTTNVQLKSDWSTPSFSGNFLPSSREVTSEGFTSKWKISYVNRSYPQLFWDSDKLDKEISDSAFGVKLILPVEHYQQCMRTSKYALLFIFLTFATFFFIETLNKKNIHPIQYLLVGLALTIFYSLLLSFSEHIGFTWAYAISTLMTIAMLTLYSIGILKLKKTSCYIGAALGCLYVYIFVLTQMETYALLAGSLGLFAILGMMMYFSQRINWNNAD